MDWGIICFQSDDSYIQNILQVIDSGRFPWGCGISHRLEIDFQQQQTANKKKAAVGFLKIQRGLP